MSASSHDSVRAGLLMLAMAAAALMWANSPWAGAYEAFSQLPTALRVGPLGLEKPLVLFVNDGLMAIFFLLVGVEIKREIAHGSLATPRQALLPALAALGGMIAPALIFAAANADEPVALHGWAIPCATDIAFSLIVMRLVAPRAPAALFILLTAIAVIDDLGAIIVIALFYTEKLSVEMLVAASLPIAVLIILNRRRVESVAPYIIAGLALWFCVLKSGVHATLAGVITAFALPVDPRRPDSPDDRVEAALAPWVAYGVLPLFALLNAGVALGGLSRDALLGSVPVGIALGLLLGKPVGILGGLALGTAVARTALPEGITWRMAFGLSLIAGIGFTMSLFIASLAFEHAAPDLLLQAKVGVIGGSLVAAFVGAAILRTAVSGRGTT
jgi:NhaA family Na+:H+ antiporter